MEYRLLILTDNQSVCKDLGSSNGNIRTHEWVIEIRRKIREYEENKRENNRVDRKVVIRWIPGHVGILEKLTGSLRKPLEGTQEKKTTKYHTLIGKEYIEVK